MITLMSASDARKESELNMEFAAINQFNEIVNKINVAVLAGEFEIRFTEKMYEENYNRLEELGYKVRTYRPDARSSYWLISWY